MNQKHTNKELLKLLLTKKMLVVSLLGFSSGLPIMVIYGSLKLWLKRYEIDLSTIGHISWIAIPYSYNFLWAFLFDRFTLNKKLGRRRSWLLLTQACLTISFILLSLGNPDDSIAYIVFMGTLLCFFSASQDVAVDAYRNEILSKDELGIGASFGVYGYRIGMWIASGFGIWVVDQETWNWSFNQMFLMLAAFMSIGIITTLVADEPKSKSQEKANLKDTVILPFIEFFKRNNAFLILLFIFLFKFGDSIAGSMTRPFYADIGFSNKDIGTIASTLGLFSSLLGLFLGGTMIYRLGQYKALWIGGILQALSTGCFSILAFLPSKINFAFVVFFEDVASGIGTACLVAYMGSLVNKKFTATQYALLASLSSLGRTLFSGFSGDLIKYFNNFEGQFHNIGYIYFFITCMIFAIPGLFLLIFIKKPKALKE